MNKKYIRRLIFGLILIVAGLFIGSIKRQTCDETLCAFTNGLYGTILFLSGLVFIGSIIGEKLKDWLNGN